MTKINNRFLLRGFWAAGAMIAAYLCFWLMPGVFWTMNAKAVDRLFMIRSNMASLKPVYDDSIVHVDVNDSSIQDLDNFYLNRSHFAQVVENLSNMDVAAQVFDFIFAVKTSDNDDRKLIDAVSNAGNAYFGMAFQMEEAGVDVNEESRNPPEHQYLENTLWQIPIDGSHNTLNRGRRPLITYPDLASASAGLGLITVKPDLDGVFRRIPLLVRYKNGVYPSLSLKVICDYLGVAPDNIEIYPGRHILLKDADNPVKERVKDILIPIDGQGNMIINFIGPWGTMKHYRFADVYQASEKSGGLDIWADELADKITVISNVSTGSTDIGPVPTDGSFPLSGLHSNALHTILTESFMKEASPSMMLGIEMTVILAFVFFSLRFSPILFSVTTAAAAGAYLGVAVSAFLFTNLILPLARPFLMMFLAFVAIQIIAALENAKKFAEADKAKEIAEHDLEIGRKIQAGFFPDALPKPDGWELSAHFQAARQVAGDFYDMFSLGKDRLIAIVVADVCDKGVGAALFMALIRSLLRSSTIQYFDEKLNGQGASSKLCSDALKTVVSRVNNYLDQTHEDANMFATLFIGLLDPKTGTLNYINAGHEKPILIGPEGVKAELGTSGPAVGAFPDVDYNTDAVQLAPGDICFVCTDGVTDAKNPSGEFFTKEKLVALLTEPFETIVEMRDHINGKLISHIADAEQFDDITMVLFRRNI